MSSLQQKDGDKNATETSPLLAQSQDPTRRTIESLPADEYEDNAQQKQPWIMVWLHFCILFVLTSALTVGFVTGFSGMGFGLAFIQKSFELHDEARVIIAALSGAILTLYLTDMHKWPTALQIVLGGTGFVALCIVLLVMVTETPFGPLCVYTLLQPSFAAGIQYTLYRNVPGSTFLVWTSRVLLVQGLVLLALFFAWAARGENMWDSPTRAYYSDKCRCAVNYQDFPGCVDTSSPDQTPCFYRDDPINKVKVTFGAGCPPRCLGVYEACGEAFLLWFNPALASMALIVFSFLARYMSNYQKDPQDSYRNVAAFCKVTAVVLFLLWIAASLIGAGEGLSNSLIAFCISLFLGSFVLFSVLFWLSARNKVARQNQHDATAVNMTVADVEASADQAVKEAKENRQFYTDVLKGLVILAALPLLLVYVLLSVVNQALRRLFLCCSCDKWLCSQYTDKEKQHRGWVTVAVAEHIQDFKQWDHSRVLTYAVYWGFGYIFFNVLASKFTTLFLSWLIEFTKPMNVALVTVVVTSVGMVMFMLPPIPGIPIYLTAGIVLVSTGEESMGLWGSIAYACVVSIGIKILGCLIQQKVIGEMFGRSVSVRQMVGINSEGIRAMRVVLSGPKLTKNKVFVLVGGPDWPVSVLCGILGLPVGPIMVGTLPVAALIIPTVFAGSFAYMGSLEGDNFVDLYPWADTMAAVAAAIIAVCMGAFTLSAAGAVKETLQQKQDEIAAIPMDAEVQKADDVAKEETLAYRQATVWSNMPAYAKGALILSVGCMIACFTMLVAFNTQCFEEYDLLYTINEHLGGKWYNLVKPLGRYALLLMMLSYICLKFFQAWAMKEMKKVLKERLGGSQTASSTGRIV